MNSSVKIMGIVNINGDSFFCGSRVASGEEFSARVEKLFADGADVVDIGACSSRPGSEYPGVDEEWQRLEPMLNIVRARFAGKRFSIDTFSSEIVRRSFCMIGPFMVNDITAGQSDPKLLPMVARLDLSYIAMHNENPPLLEGCTPEPIITKGDDITARVKDFFRQFEQRAEKAGIYDWILDPGYGFGKDVEENLELLDRQDELKCFGREILAGISRKRMTYERQGRKPEDDGTLAETRRLQNLAISHGATWIRCHDIA